MLSPGLFASAISNVEEVSLNIADIPQEKMEALFRALMEKEIPLRKLDLLYFCTDIDTKAHMNIRMLEPAVVGEAVNRLEEFRMEDIHVNIDHLRAILQNMVKGGSKLNKLKLHYLHCRYFDLVHPTLDPALVGLVQDNFREFFDINERGYITVHFKPLESEFRT